MTKTIKKKPSTSSLKKEISPPQIIEATNVKVGFLSLAEQIGVNKSKKEQGNQS